MEHINTHSVEQFLQPYLPQKTEGPPFVTLTWAQSLDSRISAAPGERTRLSGLYSKKMTHFLRSRHDAILVGCNTVLADNPRLNCRYSDSCNSPTPVVLDPKLKWKLDDNWEDWAVLASASRGETKGPVIVVNENTDIPQRHYDIIESQCGGQIVKVSDTHDWKSVFEKLAEVGFKSVMVEGGAQVINTCMQNTELVNSVIITIAPVFLGKGGVDPSPSQQRELKNVGWWSDEGVDSVVAGSLA